ncbi:hypothetical protein ACA910_007693 [Epithemia clementina (nom. ined.)]
MTNPPTAAILTEETIPQYIQEYCWDTLKAKVPGLESYSSLGDEGGLKVTPITGGNVNYAFCLHFSVANNVDDGNNATTITVFLKQAPEFVAIFGPDGFPLTSQRMQREINVYQEWNTMLESSLARKYLPEIYYFDRTHMAVLMEFLDGYQLLDHLLVQEPQTPKPNQESSLSQLFSSEMVTTSLGDFMGRTHALTHSSQITAEREAALTEQFENREMRDIQLQFVFTKCYKEATDEQRLGLTLTPEFLEQVELLKDQYNGMYTYENEIIGKNLVLTHGDLHPGSVMVHPTTCATKVIDPEFTVYGPPGLDVGSLLSGYILGAIHQAHAGHAPEAQAILQGAQSIWNQYVKTLETVLLEESNSKKNAAAFVTSLIQIIAVETVGFAAAEVCRTALEFAGGRRWLQFDDAETKAAAKKAALTLVQNCMIARHDHGIELLWKEMERAASTT